MDQKLSVLTALYFHQIKNTQLTEEVIQDTKALLGLFVEEIVSDGEYAQILDLLLEEKQIEKKDDKWYVSRIGEALVDSINDKLLGQANVERLAEIIQSYAKNKREYLRNVNSQLNTLHERREQKVKDADAHLIRVIGILVSLNYKQEHLIENCFDLSPQMLRQEEALTREINYSAKRLTQRTGLPISVQRMDKGFKFITFIELKSAELFGQTLSPNSYINVQRSQIKDWNTKVVSTYIAQCLQPIGYVSSSQYGQTYTNYQKAELVETNLGILRESPSFKVDYSQLKDDQVFLWLDSYISPSMRVLDFLEDNSAIDNTNQVLPLLKDFKLRVLPSGQEVELQQVLSSKDLATEQIPGSNISYAEHWNETLGMPLTKTQQPLLVVKMASLELHYPAEMVYIDRYSLQTHFGESPNRQIKISSPKTRFNEIQDLFFSIKSSSVGRQTRFVNVILEGFTPTAYRLIEFGAAKSVVRIRPPMLEFDKGVLSSDPSDIFREDFAPLCGKKNLFISHLITPDFLADSYIDIFIQELRHWFGIYKFGSISKKQEIKIIKYDPNADISIFEEKIRMLTPSIGNNIAIGILPNQGAKHYYAMKRLFPMKTQTPIQSVQLSTFNDIVNRRFRGFKILSLKILVKTLKEGETIWRLSNSAGLLQERSLYIGIGFSRFPRERKVSKCAAVLHDARGSKVSWKVFATPQDRTITQQWFKTLLRRIQNVIEEENPTRLVFYRTGTLYEGEKEIIQEAIHNFSWLSKTEISFVSILDGSNYRFYTYDRSSNKYGNLPAGYALVMNDSEALLSTSNYDERELRQGTVVPVRLKLELGSDDIIDIIKEYHDQTYVYWLAPFTTSKMPLVTTIANKFAELTREGVSSENFFYLDL